MRREYGDGSSGRNKDSRRRSLLKAGGVSPYVSRENMDALQPEDTPWETMYDDLESKREGVRREAHQQLIDLVRLGQLPPDFPSQAEGLIHRVSRWVGRDPAAFAAAAAVAVAAVDAAPPVAQAAVDAAVVAAAASAGGAGGALAWDVAGVFALGGGSLTVGDDAVGDAAAREATGGGAAASAALAAAALSADDRRLAAVVAAAEAIARGGDVGAARAAVRALAMAEERRPRAVPRAVVDAVGGEGWTKADAAKVGKDLEDLVLVMREGAEKLVDEFKFRQGQVLTIAGPRKIFIHRLLTKVMGAGLQWYYINSPWVRRLLNITEDFSRLKERSEVKAERQQAAESKDERLRERLAERNAKLDLDVDDDE